ncbi:chemotaxis protein CheB [Sphingomonas sp.]|uniref:chemotaxis protein CheB n=1 Tax=Sphingomonas sp. TaxID=28214 RepID=UPI0018277E76|nr:chemotaxis protein CheB [Sphingomonas sp.]MBA3511669.1 response regulator [Sphingomonas sp.]
MIVDDSMVARAVLSRMVESDGQFEIVAVAGTAEDAIEALQSVRVDVILLDLEMPGAGGLRSIPRIIAAAAGARIMIVSSLADEGAEETVAALALGAADTLPKPGTGRFNGRFSEILLRKLKALGDADPNPPSSTARDLAVGNPLRSMPADPIDILAIGASTGGIHALGTLFQHLPKRIGIPILITQHLPAPFMSVFARQLGAVAEREALVAVTGMELFPDRMIIAPGDAHLTLDVDSGGSPVVRLTDGQSSSGCLPSLDPMLASVGALYGARAMGVVLSGMGRDGVEGAGRMVACGGSILAQDSASSAVWGMPRAVLEAGLACAVMPPDKLARRIASRTGDSGCR